MQVTITFQNMTKTLEVNPEALLADVRAMIAIEFKVPIPYQVLIDQGRLISSEDDMKTLLGAGIYHNSTLQLSVKVPQVPSACPARSKLSVLKDDSFAKDLCHQNLSKRVICYHQLDATPDFEALTNELLSQVEKTPALLVHYDQHPELVDAIKVKDRQRIAAFLKLLHENKIKDMQTSQERWRKAMIDPLSEDAQQLAYEQIQQEQLDDAYLRAREFLPESFGHVPMTYVSIEINNIQLPAFIDSGAQSTIMSEECANRCRLMRFVDRRFKGVAQGVGLGKIIGRIHLTQVKLGNTYFAASIIIISNSSVDFLFGLDLLRRHQCILDYKRNVLQIQNEEIPFLPEHKIPQHTPAVANAVQSSSSSITQNEVSASSSNQVSKDNTDDQTESTSALPEQFEQTKIESLMVLGASRDQAIEALREANGEMNLAADILIVKFT